MSAITAQEIVATAAEVFGVDHNELISQSRARHLAQARQAAMWLLNKLREDISQRAAARYCGVVDHTTVLYGVRRASLRAATDTRYAELLMTAHAKLISAK